MTLAHCLKNLFCMISHTPIYVCDAKSLTVASNAEPFRIHLLLRWRQSTCDSWARSVFVVGAVLCIAECLAASLASAQDVPLVTSSHPTADGEPLLGAKQKSAPLNVTCPGSHEDIQPSQSPHIQCPRPGPLGSSCDSQPRMSRVTSTVSLLSHSPTGEFAARVGEQPCCSLAGFLAFCEGEGRPQDQMLHHSGFHWLVCRWVRNVLSLSAPMGAHKLLYKLWKVKEERCYQLCGLVVQASWCHPGYVVPWLALIF